MPNTESAKKALRQNQKRRTKNLVSKKRIKDAIKKYKKNIESGNTHEAEKMLPSVYKILDKAAKNGVIKKNKSNRLKSRLASRLKNGVGGNSDTKSDIK